MFGSVVVWDEEEEAEKEEGFHAHGRDGREERKRSLVEVFVKRAKKAIDRVVKERILMQWVLDNPSKTLFI